MGDIKKQALGGKGRITPERGNHDLNTSAPPSTFVVSAALFYVLSRSDASMTQLTSPPKIIPSHSLLPLRIITHNIRYAPPPTSLLPHEPPWPARLPLLTSQFQFLTSQSLSIICLQEVLTSQIIDLSASLGPEWEWYGLARDDGVDAGERCVVLWQNDRWDVVSRETVWLNETGAVGERGWDAGCVRVVSCAVLDAVVGRSRGDYEDGRLGLGEGENRSRRRKRVLVLNTHLDNVGVESRRQSAYYLLCLLQVLRRKYGPDFYVLAGDLNSEIDGEAYQILNNEGSELKDALTCVRQNRDTRYGENYTYTGFDGKGDEDEKLQRIDFVFVQHDTGNESDEKVKSYAVMPNNWEDGTPGRMSDHRAVCVDLVI